jgi:hypothetical protein
MHSRLSPFAIIESQRQCNVGLSSSEIARGYASHNDTNGGNVLTKAGPKA